jgi:hypothetical protein
MDASYEAVAPVKLTWPALQFRLWRNLFGTLRKF